MAERMRNYKKKYPIIRISVAKEILHGICVSNLAYRIGKEMDFSEEMCHDLAVAGFLHDIGKMELVKYVYGHEEETLTIEEIKYVRRHATLGADALERMGYSSNIVEMVRYHHENCDGSGYPMNLSREEIPMGSRVIRVCDVFAALTANRPYRKAFDPETAVELMIDEAKNYDIGVFLAFMRVIHGGNLEGLIENHETEEQLKRLTREVE